MTELDYCYVEPQDDELMHYGVKGMHWGIRRYQPYPDGSSGRYIGKKDAKKIKKSMNTNSFLYSNAKYMREKSIKRANKYSEKGKEDKARKELSDAKFHKDTMKKAQSAISKSIKQLNKAGYSVSSKEKSSMMIDKGRMILGQALLGPIGQIILAPRRSVTNYKVEQRSNSDKPTITTRHFNSEKDMKKYYKSQGYKMKTY